MLRRAVTARVWASAALAMAFISAPVLADGPIYGADGAGYEPGPLPASGGEYVPALADQVNRARADGLHVVVEEHPEIGLIIIGVGKAGKGPNGPRSRGFMYCKCGTGYDGNWNITGEKYVFGPGESVFFGGHYEDLYEGRWAGSGWYRPDGSVYSENQYQTWIPDPPSGQYWEWYNVVYWYDPMPASMQQEEGNWTAKWYDNGSNVCNKTYTAMYVLSDDTTCKGMGGDNWPSDRTSTFLVTDQYVYSWVQCDNFAMNQSDDFRWRWYGPEGFYTEVTHDADNPGSGSWWGWYRAWARIGVDGAYVAEHPGNWYVDVYIKDYAGNYDHKLTHNFTVNCVTFGPTITQQPDPPAATICEGDSQQWCVAADGTGSLGYQWQWNSGSGWQVVSGAASSCYDAAQAGSYRCVITDACGSTTSNSVSLTVRTGPTITQQPDPPLAVVCEGDSQHWCILASGSTPLDYQWQSNTGSGWFDVTGEIDTCIDATMAGSYRCAVSNDCGGPIYSNSVTLAVSTPPVIDQQPTPPSATVCEGTGQQWCVGTSGSEPISYQWQRNIGSGWTDVSGATSDCYDAMIEASYRCVVWNDCGGPLYSDTVTLTVDTAPAIMPINDHETPAYEPYSYVPATAPGTTPADSWLLVTGPPGMDVDLVTGEVTWDYPTPPDSTHPVTIEATNVCGATQESWTLTVGTIPLFTIGGQIYTDLGNPMFSGIDGVTVDVDGPGGSFSTLTETIGVPGMWIIEDVPAGEYTVAPSLAMYCFTQVIDGVPGDPPPITILVNAENQAENQSLQFLAEQVTDCYGDLNGDDEIGLSDLATLLAHYGNPGPWTYADGDMNCDGEVDLSDLATLLSVYGQPCE